jgi:hypothetical protein
MRRINQLPVQLEAETQILFNITKKTSYFKLKVIVKQSSYWPGVAQRVPGS